MGAAQTLHCGVDTVERVEHLKGFRNVGVGVAVCQHCAGENMKPEGERATAGAHSLLLPLHSFKLHEHRRERIDSSAGKVRAVVVP